MQQADMADEDELVNVHFTALPESLIAYKVDEEVLRHGQLRVSSCLTVTFSLLAVFMLMSLVKDGCEDRRTWSRYF